MPTTKNVLLLQVRMVRRRLTGIGDKERDMSQEKEPASKKSKSDSTTKPDSTAEERDPTKK